MDNKDKFPPIWLILIVFLLYGGVFLFSRGNRDYSIRSDSVGYIQLAKNLKTNFVFSVDEFPPFNPESFRLPGYPVFLAVLNATNPEKFTSVVAAQCLIGVLLIFAAWPALARLGTRNGAIVGAVILTLDLVTLFHAPLVLPELLLQLFIVLAMVRTCDWIYNHSTGSLVMTGIAWSVASLIKPIAFFIPFVIFIIQISHFRKAVLFLILSLSLPFLWAVRNSLMLGRFVYTSQGGYALLLYPAAGALSIQEKISTEQAVKTLVKHIHDTYPDIKRNTPEESALYKQVAVKTMKKYPFSTVKYHLVGVLRMLGGTGVETAMELVARKTAPDAAPQESMAKITGTGTFKLLKKFPALIPLQVGYMVFLTGAYLFFLGGCYKLVLAGNIRHALIFLMPFLLLIAVACHQGYYRFRIPLMPFVAFGAACFFRKRERV